MKSTKSLLIAALAWIVMSIAPSVVHAATDGNPKRAERKSEKSSQVSATKELQLVQRFVRQQVGYPEFLTTEVPSGSAQVLLRVSETGEVESVMVLTDDARLADYVKARLMDTNLSRFPLVCGKSCRFQLEFRYVN